MLVQNFSVIFFIIDASELYYFFIIMDWFYSTKKILEDLFKISWPIKLNAAFVLPKLSRKMALIYSKFSL